MTTFAPSEMALRYAALGWFVIPVDGKRPIGNDWQNVATNNQATVARLFAQNHHDGVGVLVGPRSGIIDFDCDSLEAEETLVRLFDGAIPKTPSFKSTRGRHVLFKWTDKLPRPDLIKIVVDGLEIRTGSGEKGAQTVFPTSGAREWTVWPDDCPLADIPDHVIERINARYAELNLPKAIIRQAEFATDSSGGDDVLNVPRWLAKHGREIIGRTDGNDGVTRWHIECPGADRHTTSNSFRDCCVTQDASGKLGGSCFHSSCGMSSWHDLKVAIGEPCYADYHDIETYPEVDISGITEATKSPDIPSELIKEDDFDDDDETTGHLELAFPDECLRPPGLIGELVDFNLATAKYPQPELALAGAIALMSVITGRRVRDLADTRTNLMIVVLAQTGCGKEWSRKINKSILEYCGANGMYEEKVASNAALHGFLQKSYAGILMNDEFGDWLSLARSKNGANTQPAQIISSMLKLYSSPSGNYKADRYAENSKQIEINQPHLVLYGTSTGEVFWKHVTPDYLAGGLLGRLIVFESRGYVYPVSMRGREFRIPENISSEVSAWLNTTAGGGNLHWENPTPIIVPHSSDALDRYEAHELQIAKKRDKEQPIRAALWSRTAENTAKLALLFACSRSRNPLQIQIEDVDLAITMSNWLTRRKVSLCDDHVAENATEDATKRVYRMIKEARDKGLSKYQLTKKTQWLKARERNEIITDLVNSNQISSFEVRTKTKSKMIFVDRMYIKVRTFKSLII